MNQLQHTGYTGLGITANGPRKIYDGRQFEAMFPSTVGSDPIVNNNAEVHDTLHFVAKVVKNTLNDTKELAKALKRSDILSTSSAVFNFFYKHYAYKLDKQGVEQVRRPARAWKDRKTGIDCDCFSTSVSSVLTNLGIDHYLKIIAINGRDYFQHIYVVVPKFKDADISKRSNYWVIDPVLNSFDEEAPKITKVDYLKMEGIPLQYLNGVDAAAAGLGREFDALENSLNGVEDMEGLGWSHFRKAMHAHVKNTRRKIETSPSSVEAVYQPEALGAIYRQLDTAFTKDDATLMGELERLAEVEHLALQPRFRHAANAIHVHDDHLYGVTFGDIDDNMISGVSGLGKKGRSKAKASGANKKHKAGPVRKIKNAVKKAKTITKAAGKKAGATAKKALKKIGKAVVKYNPVSLAARKGFLVAMRTNFSKLAEKAYWGYQTKEFAMSKGINADYYQRCVDLLEKIKKVFIKTLKGDESALKKAIVNGRAAKKIAKQLKKRGMSGVSELMGLGTSLGAADPASVTAIITASLAFLTPIVAIAAKSFKGKKSGMEAAKSKGKKGKKNKDGSPVNDSVENENGTESEGPSDDNSENINETVSESNNPDDSTNDDDGSVEAANKANDEDPSGENFNNPAGKDTKGGRDKNDTTTKVGAGVAVLALLGIGAAVALKKGKSKKDSTNGLGNFSAKRESKKLKKSLSKKKLKLPHGYQVQKREKIKAVNI